jgi:hypothetical protein
MKHIYSHAFEGTRAARRRARAEMALAIAGGLAFWAFVAVVLWAF